MTRTKVLLVIFSVLLVFGLGVGIGLYFGGSTPGAGPEAFGELDEVAATERVKLDESGPPAWTLRVGPTGSGGEKGSTLRAPDQPGWTARVGPSAYDMTLSQLVVVARSSVRLGEVVGDGDVRRVEPFVLAALEWKEEGGDDMETIERLVTQVVALLKKQTIATFANPVAISRPSYPSRPETWEDERKAWVGLPVPLGTELAAPLIAVPFQGADVVVTDSRVPVIDEPEDWKGMIEAARTAGREPAFPILYRYGGWIPLLQGIHVQRSLPLVDPPAAP